MLELATSIFGCFLLVGALVARADVASSATVQEFYGEVASVEGTGDASGKRDLFQGMMIATTRISFRPETTVLPVSPIVSGGFSNQLGAFVSAGLHVATPWIPSYPDLYAAARLECRAYDHTRSCWMVSASGESRHGKIIRLNADGGVNKTSASGQVRAMFDGLRLPGLILGAGVGAHFYQDSSAVSRRPQAITEVRWSPTRSLVLDVMAKASARDKSPQIIVSFGGML